MLVPRLTSITLIEPPWLIGDDQLLSGLIELGINGPCHCSHAEQFGGLPEPGVIAFSAFTAVSDSGKTG